MLSIFGHLKPDRSHDKYTHMPLYLIERKFAEQLNVNRDDATAVTQVNADAGIQWLYSS
jgi:hypothetical protein